MSKVLKIENHFYGSIGQHIDHVDNMSVTFDKDMNMHIEQLDELHAEKRGDIQSKESTDAKNATVHREPNQQLPFLVLEKLEELGLYTYEQFATMYRKAVEGDAHTLADFLHKYEKVGVFDFRGYEKNEVYEALREYFPTMKTYKYNNFVTYF